jgi:hypothetical protein
MTPSQTVEAIFTELEKVAFRYVGNDWDGPHVLRAIDLAKARLAEASRTWVRKPARTAYVGAGRAKSGKTVGRAAGKSDAP